MVFKNHHLCVMFIALRAVFELNGNEFVKINK